MKHFVFVGAGLLALLAGNPAKANSESYGPSFCAAYFNGVFGGTDYSQVPYVNATTAFVNDSASNMYVSCPLVRTDTENTNGTNFAVMYVYNRSGNTTSCTFYSRDIFGNGLSGNWYNYESTTQGGDQALYFNPYPSVSSEWGPYSIFCTLSPGAAVLSYTVFEN
jgi:hypothetical protein